MQRSKVYHVLMLHPMRLVFWGVAVTALLGASSQIPAQTAPMPAAFEVASIRLHDGPLHRFRLTIHRERRETGVYALVAGKQGPALKVSNSESPCSIHVSLASDGRNEIENFANCTMDALVDHHFDWCLSRIEFEPN